MGEDRVVLGNGFPVGHLFPHLEAILHENTVIPGSEEMPFRTKMIQDRSKSSKKALGLDCSI